MFGTALEWIIFILVIIVILLVAVFMASAYHASKKFGSVEDTLNRIDYTSSNVNNFVAEGEEVLDYVKNGICTSSLARTLLGPPPPGFCPTSPAPASV